MRIATLDVGTNTVLLLVAETTHSGLLRAVLERAEITRVGRGVERTGKLDSEAARRTLETIVDFAGAARAAGASRIVAVATSALRDAKDGADFVRRVKERAGIDLQIIGGREEAELSHLAVIRGLDINPGKSMLIVDIGGGSTELIRAEPGRDLQTTSVQMGSVRLTEQLIHHDPPAPGEIERLRASIDGTLQSIGWNWQPALMVGIAGTVTTVCAVALEMDTYDHSRVHGHVLPRREVSRVTRLLCALTTAQRSKLKGMIEGRADVICAGAIILERVMEHFNAASVVVSDQGVRWGLAWRELKRASGTAQQPG